MFSRNKDKETNKSPAFSEKVSIIAKGMQISGDIESEGDIRIDGEVRGNVFCKSKVVIIASGKVLGDIQAVTVDVHGEVTGNIVARELLSLKSSARIDGNLVTDKLQIEPNAVFNGECSMGVTQASSTKVTEEGELLREHYEEK